MTDRPVGDRSWPPPGVACVHPTTSNGPVQWVGDLSDGRRFCFRWRSHWASLGVGDDDDQALLHAMTDGWAMETEEHQARALDTDPVDLFLALLRRARRRRPPG